MSPRPARSLPAALLSTLLFATGLIGLAPAAAHAHEAERAASGDGIGTGRIVVRFRDTASRQQRDAARAAAGTARRAVLPALGVEVLDSTSPTRSLRRLRSQQQVLWAQPEVLARRFAEVATTPERQELALEEARTLDPRLDGAGVRVAVIDDGVFPIADLSGRLLDGGDCSGDVCRPFGGVNNLDEPGFGSHGTAVAAIIAAGRGNGVGIIGAAPAATVISYRVFADIAGGASDVSIANALVAAADDGVDVANLSLGTPFDSLVMRDAIAYARRVRPDMVVVAASGNDSGARPNYPAGSSTVLSVGASSQYGDGQWRVAPFSTRGDVDVLAPGSNVRTWYTEPTADNPAGFGAPTGTTLVQGSSFAAPEVAGIVAGLAGAGVKGDRARAAVAASAEPAGPVTDIPAAASGSGRADALTALRLAAGTGSYAAGFVDGGGFVARGTGVRRVETLRFDPSTAAPNGPAPVRIEAGGGRLGAVYDQTARVVAGGQLVRAAVDYTAASTTSDDVRLAIGAPEDDGSTLPLRVVDATAGPEGVPAATGAAVTVDLAFGLTSAYVRTVPLTAGQLVAIEFGYAAETTDVTAVVWAPGSTGGAARPTETPDAFEPSGASSGLWLYTAPTTGTYAIGLITLSPAGDGQHRIGAQFPVVPTLTVPTRVRSTGTRAVLPLSWGLAVDGAPVAFTAGTLRWDVALQTVSRDRNARTVLSPLRVVAAATPSNGIRLTVSSVGRYRVQVRPVIEGAPVAAWSAPKDVIVLPLRAVRRR